MYVYDVMRGKLRIQILHIITDTLGQNTHHLQDKTGEVYDTIVSVLMREYGRSRLSEVFPDNISGLQNFFLNEADYEHALDVVELTFQLIDTRVRTQYYQDWTSNRLLTPDEAISDLNHRFKENGVGYQYESGQLLRLDSNFIHSEAVKPVLLLLSDPRFEGANDEFLDAHLHYRERRHEECLLACCKAFESTMKSACSIKGWDFKPTDSAKGLITTCVNNRLFPSYLESQITSLRTLFESGIPTIRNKVAGHGRGVESRDVPQHYARYVLNLTATTVLFIVELALEQT